MLSKRDLFSLINAANVSSGLLDRQFAGSVAKFQSFSELHKGVPILIPANDSIFKFSKSDIFELPKGQILKSVYGLNDEHYIGFKHAFESFKFLEKYDIKPEVRNYYKTIKSQNSFVFDEVRELKQKHTILGAFQTRNIPHSGHEKIIAKMLEYCDHLVVNPVVGPKKVGDINLLALQNTYGNFMNAKYNGKISFLPITANMFYAGPREAFHHAIMRENLGFDFFSVGRDHAGAENVFRATDAPNLVKRCSSNLSIEVLAHYGTVYCEKCSSIIFKGDCTHKSSSYTDISGSNFRECLKQKTIFEYADTALQEYLWSINFGIFEE